jgi:hypothetical protein
MDRVCPEHGTRGQTFQAGKQSALSSRPALARVVPVEDSALAFDPNSQLRERRFVRWRVVGPPEQPREFVQSFPRHALLHGE